MTSDQEVQVLKSAADFPFLWQRRNVCPIYDDLVRWGRWGDFGVYKRENADEDDQGGTTAWEVWHWPSNSVESDWFEYIDATMEARRLYAAARWPDAC